MGNPLRNPQRPQPMNLHMTTKLFTWTILALSFAQMAQAQDGHGSIVGWGEQVVGADLSADFVAVAAGGDGHSLGLKRDGSIVTWGFNGHGQCDGHIGRRGGCRSGRYVKRHRHWCRHGGRRGQRGRHRCGKRGQSGGRARRPGACIAHHWGRRR